MLEIHYQKFLCVTFRERIYQLERKEMELEMEERKLVEEKKNKINEAARKADEPVDDSKLVEAMFDFLPDSSSEAPTPGGNVLKLFLYHQLL